MILNRTKNSVHKMFTLLTIIYMHIFINAMNIPGILDNKIRYTHLKESSPSLKNIEISTLLNDAGEHWLLFKVDNNNFHNQTKYILFNVFDLRHTKLIKMFNPYSRSLDDTNSVSKEELYSKGLDNDKPNRLSFTAYHYKSYFIETKIKTIQIRSNDTQETQPNLKCLLDDNKTNDLAILALQKFRDVISSIDKTQQKQSVLFKLNNNNKYDFLQSSQVDEKPMTDVNTSGNDLDLKIAQLLRSRFSNEEEKEEESNEILSQQQPIINENEGNKENDIELIGITSNPYFSSLFTNRSLITDVADVYFNKMFHSANESFINEIESLINISLENPNNEIDIINEIGNNFKQSFKDINIKDNYEIYKEEIIKLIASKSPQNNKEEKRGYQLNNFVESKPQHQQEETKEESPATRTTAFSNSIISKTPKKRKRKKKEIEKFDNYQEIMTRPWSTKIRLKLRRSSNGTKSNSSTGNLNEEEKIIHLDEANS
eukprot:GAHX01002384.1.p1 GENE.GAHX01002384.1~~GAHX01002384.1.p1  ORF type:complete len:486 (-),score=91.58 GAHX01002384.1:974-2431(-)